MTLFSRAICAIAFSGLLGLACSRATAQSSNGVLREVYLNITGSSLPDLTNNPALRRQTLVDGRQIVTGRVQCRVPVIAAPQARPTKPRSQIGVSQSRTGP